MNNGNICVSVFAATAAELRDQIRLAEPLADIVELRLDFLKPEEIDDFINHLPPTGKRYLFTFRPRSQGGSRELTVAERTAFWAKIYAKLRGTDHLIDHETDLPVPADFPADRVIVSHHDFASPPTNLRALFDKIADSSAATIKIAVRTDRIDEAVSVWQLLDAAKARGVHVVPIAMGEAGKWTRVLGPAYGAFMTYAGLGRGRETAPGQMSAADLHGVYRVKQLDLDTGVYGIIAGDTTYSMSPHIHNPAFRARGVNAVFVPFQVAELDTFVNLMVKPEIREIDLNFQGFSVTNPHKRSIIKHLHRLHGDAAAIGSVNTIKIFDGEMHGYNTDADAFLAPLKNLYGSLKDARCAIVGSGGAARACVHALRKCGSDITIFGRNDARAAELAAEMTVAASQLTGAGFGGYDILVNATPVGTKGSLEAETVATAEQLAKTKVVYDLIYNPTETRLAGEAKKAGAMFIGGLEMLLNQGAKQFEIWTGHDAPLDEMRRAVTNRLEC